MVAPLLALTLSCSTLAGADSTDARHVVRQAIHAAEGDSIVTVRSRWSGRLHADSADRAALLGLATLARLTYDYPASDRLYLRLFDENAPHPGTYAVYARLGRAWSLEERGQSDAAGDEFARARDAARASGNPTAEAEALIGLAFARGPTAGMTAAKAMLDTAGPLIPATALDLQAERGWRRAMIRALLGEPGATNEATASVALARRSGELRVQAQAVRGLARILDWRGEEDSALAAFEQAERLFRQARDRSWLAVTLMNKGNLFRKRADLGETIEALRLASAEGEASHNLWAVASAHTGLGVVALQLNDFPEASRQLNRAVTMFEAQGDRSSAMNARGFLPLIALADRDFATARRQTLEGLEFYRGTGETSSQFAALRTLFTIAIREHDWAGAERALADERALLPRLDGPQWEVTLTFDQGRLARARGALAPAERSFRQFLAGLDSADHPAVYDARLRLADIYAERGKLDAAEREATSAWDELERWRATLTDRELRLLAFQVTRSEYQASPAGASDQRASVARVLAALAAGGRAPLAFELAERRRARDLMDRMARAEGLRTHPSETEPDAHAALLAAGPLTAAALAALIPDGRTAVLEYVTGASGAPTTLFVVTRPGPDGVAVRAHVLAPADSLVGPLTRFLTQMRGEADVAPLARTLGGMLLDSALAELGGRVTRLIMVPDGPLHRVPWDLLRLPDGRYVVEQYSVSVTPSAGILAALWRHPRAGRTTDHVVRLLAFGDPAYGTAAVDSIGELPRLEGSGREARLVARYSPEADVRLRREASATFLEHAPLEPYRIIHFATHALVDERSAARTVLALAPDSSNNGQVGPGDLAALRIDADLVVLSGCRTAGGVIVEGEGLQGLTASLFQAGARSVVASQWRIADRGTVPFIQAFYEALARSLPVGDALRQAKLKALHRGVPPREWAAFTTVGDPLVSVRLREPWPEIWSGVMLVAALAFGAAGFVYARRSLSRSATGSPER